MKKLVAVLLVVVLLAGMVAVPAFAQEADAQYGWPSDVELHISMNTGGFVSIRWPRFTETTIDGVGQQNGLFRQLQQGLAADIYPQQPLLWEVIADGQILTACTEIGSNEQLPWRVRHGPQAHRDFLDIQRFTARGERPWSGELEVRLTVTARCTNSGEIVSRTGSITTEFRANPGPPTQWDLFVYGFRRFFLGTIWSLLRGAGFLLIGVYYFLFVLPILILRWLFHHIT
ncbi:MAG: hypothetical protein FWD06_03390 [Oscillospiraceae bacterium]|nr:hypothetical protein [Oscillospiraceae bacterium]